MPGFDAGALAQVLGAAGGLRGNRGFAKRWAELEAQEQQRQRLDQQTTVQNEQLGFQRDANTRANQDQQLQQQQQRVQAVNTIRQLLGDEAIDTPELYQQREQFATQLAPTLGVDTGFVQSLRPAPDTFTKRQLRRRLDDLGRMSVAERQQFEAGGMWDIGGQRYTPAQARAALGQGAVTTQGQPFAFTKPSGEDEPDLTKSGLDVQAAYWTQKVREREQAGDATGAAAARARVADLAKIADQMSAARQNPPAGGGAGGNDPRTNARIDRIVNSFNSHPIVKEYNEVQAQHGIIQQVVSGPWSGPGDMAAVFAFMKALDPNSVVRETEYDNAARSGNIFSGWAARFNGALSPNGGFLSDRVRRDFLRTIESRLNIKTQQYQNLRRQLVSRVDRIKAGAPETGDEALIDYASGVVTPKEPAPGRAEVTPTQAPPARAGGAGPVAPGANPFRRTP